VVAPVIAGVVLRLMDRQPALFALAGVLTARGANGQPSPFRAMTLR
jgi:hypothetical protein